MVPTRSFAALLFRWPSWPDEDRRDLLLAELDAFGPTAVDDDGDRLRVFFATAAARDAAQAHVAALTDAPACDAVDVPDEAWAERSQASLRAIRAGRFVVTPPWDAAAQAPNDASSNDLVIIIEPSMGFGTGHHASTRTCLTLLQRVPVEGRTVIDVGTGSGVLALAAWRLGATRVLAIDYDLDAIASARDNVDRHQATSTIALRVCDLGTDAASVSGTFDVVLGNLTGAVLARLKEPLARFVRPGGVLIASGFQLDEESRVVATFGDVGLVATDRVTDLDWVGLTFTNPTPSTAR